VASGRPSRTGQDEIRNARGVSESSSVAWATVRDLYPTNIVRAVDGLVERGGVTMSDLSAFTLAQLLSDLEDQSDGAEVRSEISRHLRLLFRIVAVSGGHGDMDTVMVRVPDELAVMPSPDDGDELM